jgi:hypothetical protein
MGEPPEAILAMEVPDGNDARRLRARRALARIRKRRPEPARKLTTMAFSL